MNGNADSADKGSLKGTPISKDAPVTMSDQTTSPLPLENNSTTPVAAETPEVDKYGLPATGNLTLKAARRAVLFSLLEAAVRRQHFSLKRDSAVYYLASLWVRVWWTVCTFWLLLPPASWAVYAADSVSSTLLEKLIKMFPPLLHPIKSEKGLLQWLDNLMTQPQSNWIKILVQYVSYVYTRLLELILYVAKNVAKLIEQIQAAIHGFFNDDLKLSTVTRDQLFGFIFRRWVLICCWGWTFELYYHFLGVYLNTVAPILAKWYNAVEKYRLRMETASAEDSVMKTSTVEKASTIETTSTVEKSPRLTQ